MVTGLDTPNTFDTFIHAHPAAAVYFGSAACGVCEALWPKLEAMLCTRFPKLSLARVETAAAPALAAAHGVFTVPVIIVWFEGREWVRKAGAFSLAELEGDIMRPYQMLFGGSTR
ncbi:MAG: thioredoxin family protein [Thiohalomonadaceae bacterium]